MKKKIFILFVVSVLVFPVMSPNISYSFDPTFTVDMTPDCEFISLNWSSVIGANGYYVYRGIGSGNQVPEPITDFPLKETSYEDWNDIKAGTEYCYFIRAVGSDHKEFAQSNEVCAVPVCPEDCRLELKFQVGNNVYWINDVPQPAMEAAPEVKWSRTFVLIRYAAETAGAEVGWEGATKSITVETLDGTMIKMQVGNNKATINGEVVQIDANNSKVAPYIVAGRTLCPLRFTGTNLGATGPEDILWDNDTKSAMLYFQDPDCGNNMGGGSGDGTGDGSDPGTDPGSGGGGSGSGTATDFDTHNIFPDNIVSGGGIYTPPKGSPTKTSNFSAGLGEDWVGIQGGGGNFDKFAKFSGGTLIVDVPEGNSWGKTGIRSKEPYFEITEDMNTNPLAITFDFDPDKTDGFVVALSTSRETQDPWNRTNVWTSFHPSPYKTQAQFGIANLRNKDDTSQYLTNITPETPKQVTITIKPGFVRASTSHGYKVEGNYTWLKPGTKVYLYVFSSSIDGKGQPSRMKLNSIKSYNGWSNTSEYIPPKGELVYTEEFDGDEGLRWVPVVNAGGDYKKYGKFGDGKFISSYPKGSSWSISGIRTKYYFVEITEDMTENPFTIFFKFDQKSTTGYRLFLTTHSGPTPPPWSHNHVWSGFVLHEYGTTPQFDHCQRAPYATVKDTRLFKNDIPRIPPNHVSLTIKPGYAKLSTSQGYTFEGNFDTLKVGEKLFLYAINQPFDQWMPSNLTMNSVKAMRYEGKTHTDYHAPKDQMMFHEDFDSEDHSMWKTFGYNFGDFKKWGKFKDGKLTVDVPGGNNMGQTGVFTERYTFIITEDMKDLPLKFAFKFDPTNTTGYHILFTNSDPTSLFYLKDGVHFIYNETSENMSRILVSNPGTGVSSRELQKQKGAPEIVTCAVSPGHVDVTTSDGDNLSGDSKAGLRVGDKVYLYIYNWPIEKNFPSSFSLDSITVTK